MCEVRVPSGCRGGRWERPGPAVCGGDRPAAGAWHGACGRRPGRWVPPWQRHSALMKRFPLHGHRAHAATGRQCLSDKGRGWPGRPAGGPCCPAVQPGLRPPQLHPLRLLGPSLGAREELGGMRQDSKLEKEKKGLQEKGRRVPSRVGTPAPSPFPPDPSLPTASSGSRGMDPGMCLSACWALCHLRDPGVSLETWPGTPSFSLEAQVPAAVRTVSFPSAHCQGCSAGTGAPFGTARS